MIKYTKADLWGKIDWEGGLGGFATYQGPNIDEYDVPKTFKTKFAKFVKLQDELQETLNEWEESFEENE